MSVPSHRLVTSGSLARLEARLFSQLRDAKLGDPLRPLVVLCASRFLGHYLARQLARNATAHAAIRFVTLNEVAAELADGELADQGAIAIPTGAKGLITRELLASLPQESYFTQVQHQPHLPEVLAATFTDIEDSRIDLARAVQSKSGAAPKLADGSKRKLREIVSLYAQYKKRLAELKMYSEADLLAAASNRAASFGTRFGVDFLPVYGFYELTNAQWEFLSALARSVSLSAYLFVEEGWHFKTAHKLRDRILHELSPQLENYDREAADSDLIAARSWVFTPRSEAREPDGSLAVLSCPNEASEAREIARECIRLKRDEHIEFTEMAVLVRDSEACLPLLASVFEHVGVPFYLREGLPLDRTVVGKSMLALLRLADSGSAHAGVTGENAGNGAWPRAEVMEWLALGAVSLATDKEHRETTYTEPPVAWWDRLSREAGIVSGERQWDEKLKAAALSYETVAKQPDCSEGKRSAMLSNAHQARDLAGFVATIIARAATWRTLRSWSELTGAVVQALVDFHSPGLIRDEVEGALRSLSQLERAAALPKHARRSSGLGMANIGIANVKEFARIAQALLSSSSLKAGKFETSGVHLVSLSSVRHARFRVVLVPGMTERSFPLVGREDPMLLDAERKVLNQAAQKNGRDKQNERDQKKTPELSLKRSRPDEERLLFLLACEAAREKLVLTFPRKEAASGAEKIPSYYLLRLLSTFGEHVAYADLAQTKPNARVTGIPNSRLVSLNARESIEEREFDLGRIRELLKSDEPLRARYLERRSQNMVRAVVSEQRTWHTDVFTEFDGVLSPERGEALARQFGPERCYSPSMLEQYARCPYHFFLKYVLRLQELEDAGVIESIDARDKGDLMHAILRDFYQKAKDEGKLPLAASDFEEHRQALRQICDAHMSEAEANGLTGYRVTWELNRKFIAQDLDRCLAKEVREGTEWRAEKLEMPFGISRWKPDGLSEVAPPLELDLGGKTMKISGQIDRLDMSADGHAVRVVDYKSGKNQSKKNFSLNRGRALQLPLYLLAAQQLFPEARLEESCAEYRYITRRGGWKTVSLAGSELLEQREALDQILRTIIEGCAKGLFPRCPGDRGPIDCSKCEYSSIGDPRHDAIWEKKKADARLAEFRQLEEIE